MSILVLPECHAKNLRLYNLHILKRPALADASCRQPQAPGHTLFLVAKHQRPPPNPPASITDPTAARAMADNEDGAICPTEAAGDVGDEPAAATEAETIARLQQDLLNAAENEPDKVMGIVHQMRRISPDANICPRDSEDDTPATLLVDNETLTDNVLIELLAMMTKDEINAGTNMTPSPLHRAIHYDRPELLRILLAAGARVDCQNSPNRYTPFHYACMFEKVEFVRILRDHAIENHVDLNTPDHHGDTALHQACLGSSVEIVELLLAPDAKMDQDVCGGRARFTPFEVAVLNGCIELIEMMIRHGSKLDSNHGGPFYLSVQRGDPRIVKMLLDLKVDCNTPSEAPVWYPFGLAALHGKKEIVRMLLDAGAAIETRNWKGRTALALASSGGHHEIVRMLLKSKSDIDTVDLDGQTPLATACFNGRAETVEFLLDNRADPTISDNMRRSPLLVASAEGYADIVGILLRHASELVHATDVEGRGALHVVGFSQHGPNPTKHGMPPCQLTRTIEILLDHGADPTLRTAAGETILHSAAKSKESDHIPVLLQHMGPYDLMATTNDGRTALAIAGESRNRDAVAILLETPGCRTFGAGGIGESLLAWAVEDERTHGIVMNKLVQEAHSVPGMKSSWHALDVAALLGDYVMVQKLLRGLSSSKRRVERIEHAIGVLDDIDTTTPSRSNNEIWGLCNTELAEPDESDPLNRDLKQSPGIMEAFGPKCKLLPIEDIRGAIRGGKPRHSSESLNRFTAIKAMLKVAESSARTSSAAGELQPPIGTVPSTFRPDTTIFDFYSSGTRGRVTRHSASVEDVIYEQGPEEVMSRKRDEESKALRMVEKLEWPDDDESQALKAEALRELAPDQQEDLRLRWIHLPANNVCP